MDLLSFYSQATGIEKLINEGFPAKITHSRQILVEGSFSLKKRPEIKASSTSKLRMSGMTKDTR